MNVSRRRYMGDKGGKDYIQNGLVFHLDGINKGENATAWTDLIGGVKFAYNSYSVVQNDHIYMNGNGYIKSNKIVEYPWDISTIEVCFERELNNSPSVLFFSNRPDTICVVLNADNTTITPYNGRTNHPYFKDIQYPNKSTISVNQSPLIVTNGFQPSYALSTDYYSSLSLNNATIGGRATDGGYSMKPFKGKIYSIRIYNRLLSSNEMIHNQRVDNQRFNLGLNI